MSTHDLTIATGSGLAVRQDIEAAVQALGSLMANTTAPSPTYPNQIWADTTTGTWKKRNNANSAWIKIGTLDQDYFTVLLNAIAELTPAADRGVYFTSGVAAALFTLTSFGRSLVDDADGAAAIATIGKATAANWRASASDKILTPDGLESAAALVTLTDAATIDVDWDTFFTGKVTLAGNRALGNPTNGQPGTKRKILVVQDGTGSRTLSYGGNYKFPGGTAPTLSTGASKTDVLEIFCETTTLFHVHNALDIR